MTFNQLVDRFLSILNRDDCDRDSAAIYLQDSLARITREARLPNMERSEVITVTDQPVQFIAIPPDLIEVIDIIVLGFPDGREDRALQLMPYRDLIKLDPRNDPIAYGRFQSQFSIRGTVPQGASIQLWYYGEFSDITSLDGSNEITTSNPDLIVYGALSFAGDVFDHPSTEKWEARYQQILGQVQGLAIDLDTKGGPSAIAPMYSE